MFKYFSCLMIRSRTLIEIDSSWALSAFLKWRDRMKITDHSWFFCSRRSWIFLIYSIFFFVVKKRSYSFDWTFTFRFSFEIISRSDDVFIICAFCVFDDVVVFETCSIFDNVVVFDSMSSWFRIIDEIINDFITFI
jgi:hypothetical protein